MPPECEAQLQPDNERPFSLKHAQQQASIVGHMKRSGLLTVRISVLPTHRLSRHLPDFTALYIC